MNYALQLVVTSVQLMLDHGRLKLVFELIGRAIRIQNQDFDIRVDLKKIKLLLINNFNYSTFY